MANLIKAAERPHKGILRTYPGILGTDGTYYKGSFLVLDPTTKKLINPTDIANLKPLGILRETTTRAGEDIVVICERFDLEVTIAGIAQTDVDSPVYCVDNDTLTLTPTAANKKFGYVIEILENGNAIVEMDSFSAISV